MRRRALSENYGTCTSKVTGTIALKRLHYQVTNSRGITLYELRVLPLCWGMIMLTVTPQVQKTAYRTPIAKKSPCLPNWGSLVLPKLGCEAMHTPVKGCLLESLTAEKCHELLISPIVTTIGEFHYDTSPYLLDMLKHLLKIAP